MDRFHLLLFLPLALAALLSSPAAAAPAASPLGAMFIRSSCLYTRYPAICERSLGGYAASVRRSPRRLAHAALAVSLTRAQSASTFVSRVASASGVAPRRIGNGAVRDCVQTVGDTVDQLRRSLRELTRMGRRGSPRFAWCLSNVQTWVSAALTDQTTCLDGLSQASRVDRGVRAAITGRIVDLSQVTSNALALVNGIGPTN